MWFLFNYLFKLLGFGNYFIFSFWIIFLIGLFVLGVFCADEYAKITGKKDASEIVIDEVVGQLLAILLSYYFAIMVFESFLALFIYFVTIFVTFRLFDILKPSLIGYFDNNLKGGYGVMVDDIFAAIASALMTNFIILIMYLIKSALNL